MKQLALLFSGVLLCAPAFASVTYQDTGTAGGQPADAEVTLTFGTGTLTVTIQNLESDPTADAQSINGLDLTIAGFTFPTVTDNTFAGTDLSNIVVNTPNGWTTAPDTTNHWIFSSTTDSFLMTAIGNPMAKYTIIGDPNSSNNEYTNANGSITMNHQPFLWESATWVLNIPGLTAADQNDISSVVFSFGTANTTSSTLTGTQVSPEPASLPLAAFGLAAVALAAFTSRRSRSSRA